MLNKKKSISTQTGFILIKLLVIMAIVAFICIAATGKLTPNPKELVDGIKSKMPATTSHSSASSSSGNNKNEGHNIETTTSTKPNISPRELVHQDMPKGSTKDTIKRNYEDN